MASSCYATEAITRVGPNRMFLRPSNYVLPLKKSTDFRVKSMSEDVEKEQVTGGSGNPNPSPKPNPPNKVSTNFSDVFSFGGPAPERINGRLAMIGFAAAMGVELASGQDLISQLQNGGAQWFLGTSAVLSLASLVPIFRGVTAESKSDGVMTSDAEILNGRLAMIGLVALAVTEFLKGSALISVV